MRLLVPYHSVLTTSMHAVINIIHYCGSSGLSANLNSPSLRSTIVRKNLHMVIVSKWHSKISHSSNTFPTPSEITVAFRYTIFYYRDPPATDDGRRKNNTILECQPGGNNEANDITVREMRAGE